MADFKGTVAADTITGTSLQDVIMATDGDDTVDGGDGHDLLYGGKGNDLVTGSSGDDLMNGDSGNDILVDGLGNDTLNGGDDNDRVVASEGNDVYTGGSGIDTIDFSAAASRVVVDLSKGTATGLTIGTDSVQGFEAVIGSGHGDTIKGSNDADAIDGGAGNDKIRGMGGADELTGGAGDDTFLWKWVDVVDAATGAHKGADTIHDFQQGDVLDLRQLLAGQVYDDIADVVHMTNVNGGTQISVSNGKTFVDVVFVEHISSVGLSDGGLLT